MTPELARRSYQEIVDHLLGVLSQQGVLTDTAPGSVTRTLVEATAREFSELYARMNAVYEAGFLDTATGASLDQLVALIGLERFAGETQIVEMSALRDERMSARVIIPAGAKVTTRRQGKPVLTCAVLDDSEIRAGEKALTISLRVLPNEEDTDADLTISTDDVTLNKVSFVDPIAGIAQLSLTGPSVALGTDESDAQLRERARLAIAAAGGGTEKAIVQAVMEVDGVDGVRLRDAGDPVEGILLRPGELEVILDGNQQRISQNQAAIEQAIERSKGPGIIARLASTQRVELGGQLVVRAASAALSDSEALALVRTAETLLQDTVEALEIGQRLHWNRLLAGLIGIDNLDDVLATKSEFRLTRNATQTTMALGDITVEPFERLVLPSSPTGLTIMLEHRSVVSIAVSIAATIQAPAQSIVEQMTAQANRVIERYLETLTSVGDVISLSHSELIDALIGPDGMTTLADQFKPALVTVEVLDTSEGALVQLNKDSDPLELPPQALLRTADPVVRFNWKDPE